MAKHHRNDADFCSGSQLIFREKEHGRSGSNRRSAGEEHEESS